MLYPILLMALSAIGWADRNAEPPTVDPATPAASSGETAATPGANHAEPAESTITDEMLARRAAALREKHGEAGFTVVVEPPFIVIGDESVEQVRQRSENTVRWAVDRLTTAYFHRDPGRIITIWLFKNKTSYNKHTRRIFNETPHTSFGYYTAEHDALIMNINTGGGTLVHEIVHPFMAADFPECPAWFNEGLGSLYEQCRDKDGRIHGVTNWRLAGLKNAIRADRTLSFKTLCAMSDARFYKDPNGVYYAQARYFCYYLQQRDVLRVFYRRFRRNHEDDPTGYRTLQAVLEVEDMAAFQQRWEKWVMTLEYP